MKFLSALFFSSRTTLILLLLFALAMAFGTFIENDFGTHTVQSLIYKTWWFEVIMVLMAINFLGNIFKYKLLSKDKISVLAFHLAFILILLGAGITRYISYEGMVSIKEGEITNVMLSQESYLKIKISSTKRASKPKVYYKKLQLSSLWNFDHKTIIDYDGEAMQVSTQQFISNYQTLLEPSKDGRLTLKLVESSSGTRKTHYIRSGSTIYIQSIPFSFNHFIPNGINVSLQSDTLAFYSPYPGQFMRMADRFTGSVNKDSHTKLMLRSLYSIGNIHFVFPEFPKKGTVITSSGDKDKNPLNLLYVQFKTQDTLFSAQLEGTNYYLGEPKTFITKHNIIELSYGARPIQLPFYLKLNDFQLEKFPGSESPKSFASEVTVIDDKNAMFDYRIFMNHPLLHKGYKFFQSSYNIDNNYEQTILSVNQDLYGTIITYIGYSLLFLSLILTLILPKTRFQLLSKTLKQLNGKTLSIIIILFFSSLGFSQSETKIPSTDSILNKIAIQPDLAEAFGKLSLQDNGRMKPVNTFANEFLRKIFKKEHYYSLSAEQTFLSMLVYPKVWVFMPIVYLEKNNQKIRKILNLKSDKKYAALLDFFDDHGNYLLLNEVQTARKTKIKSKYQESLEKIHIRLILLYSHINGYLLNIFPVESIPNNKWINIALVQLNDYDISIKDSLEITTLYHNYLDVLLKAQKTKEYLDVYAVLHKIKQRQKTIGKEVVLSQRKTTLEILYNQFDVFKSLFSKYLFASLIFFILIIIQIFKNKTWIRYSCSTMKWVIYLLFIIQTLGLATRWYISGHAPWSDAYESMIYISWATMLFGIILSKKSSITLASTAFVNAMILMIAHWNFMDPAINNLQPVLDSYWLMIHVAIIVGSYGPFTLSMILGIIVLLTYLFSTKDNLNNLKPIIKELSIINEMSITIGLFMLTIGNFLGGMWANESWGRYWGWDPKETWALISIMVYAFILHARFVPFFRSKFSLNILSVFGFTSILMTYFGVNFFLSGLHSYAKGEAAGIPNYVYYIYLTVVLISLGAYWKYVKYYKH